MQIISSIAAGLLVAAIPTSSQTPSSPTVTPTPSSSTGTVTPNPVVRGNPDKVQDHATYKDQWNDCMARMQSKEKGMKSGNHHMGSGKAGATENAAGKTQPIYEPKSERNNEAPETTMNRHEEMMQDCRNQLYGGRLEEPGTESKNDAAAH